MLKYLALFFLLIDILIIRKKVCYKTERPPFRAAVFISIE